MSESSRLNRREFAKTAGSAAAASLLFSNLPQAFAGTQRRRYAIVGTGIRGTSMWGAELFKHYSDVIEFVGLCDLNPKRVTIASEIIGVQCPTFTSFEEMCDKAKPDLLMVTTVDATHAEYITKGLDRGIDVMTEKPMVTDEKQCQTVLDAEKRNNRKIVVTFNYRYAPKHQKIKEILMSGEIGPITAHSSNLSRPTIEKFMVLELGWCADSLLSFLIANSVKVRPASKKQAGRSYQDYAHICTKTPKNLPNPGYFRKYCLC